MKQPCDYSRHLRVGTHTQQELEEALGSKVKVPLKLPDAPWAGIEPALL